MKETEIERLTKLSEYENDLHSKGYKLVAGVDEAGRGPLAGPVVAAAVILPEGMLIEGVNDSKKISEKRREKLYDEIIICEECYDKWIATLKISPEVSDITEFL